MASMRSCIIASLQDKQLSGCHCLLRLCILRIACFRYIQAGTGQNQVFIRTDNIPVYKVWQITACAVPIMFIRNIPKIVFWLYHIFVVIYRIFHVLRHQIRFLSHIQACQLCNYGRRIKKRRNAESDERQYWINTAVHLISLVNLGAGASVYSTLS